MTTAIGIIGAGMTGLTTAHHLQQAGFKVTLFEKSKSPGGRMATRRVGNGRMDHGAVYFTVRTDAFQALVDDWLKEGKVQHWFGSVHPRYVGSEGMNPLMKHYAKGLTVHLNTKITNVYYEDNQVSLTDSDGERHIFDLAIITAPLPQAIELLQYSTLPVSTKQRNELEKISFEPSYIGLFELKTSFQIGEHGLLDQDLPNGILKIVANDQKGITDSPLVTVYMDGAWSKCHDHESEATILSEILSKLRKSIPDQTITITDKQLKRWRYSQAETYYPGTVAKLDYLPVYLAGDCFISPQDEGARSRVESAFMSGAAAAGAVIADQNQ